MGKSQELYIEAKKLIPGGTQLLSKRPENSLPDFWPAYYAKAKGCEVWDLDDNHYYDFYLMGVGANVLGYANDEVDDAAKAAIERGGMCTLNAPEEVELAKLLLQLHPWAGMVRYAKTGGEAMSIATRIARAYTKKDIVLVCGYHGWHDWYLSANLTPGDPLAEVHLKGLMPLGVPRGLAGTNLIFHYNNFDEFMNLIESNRGNIAAIIMEPIRNDYPQNDFLKKIREVSKTEGILLVFDEVSAGFRLCAGGSHRVLGVEPDIATFAKGMTNGYPLSAVIGRTEIMQAAQDTFISSTYFTERIALAATVKSIKYYQDHNVDKILLHVGQRVRDGWVKAAENNGLNLHLSGIIPLSHFSFDFPDHLEHKTFFTQEMLKRGFLAAPMFYASIAHTDEIIDRYIEACDEVFALIANIHKNGQSIKDHLDGPVCYAGFDRLL